MKHRHPLWARTACTGLAVLAVLAATAAPARAVDGNLPGGTSISVTINSPPDGAIRPPGPVTVTGTASVGQGVPRADTALIYVLDVSGSTDRPDRPGCGGDQNGDGVANRVLDCEIAAAKALNAVAIDLQTVGDTGAAIFASSSAGVDVGPAGGDQLITSSPGNDADGAGGPDVPQVLSTVFSDFDGDGDPPFEGGVGEFTGKTVGNGTNFAAGIVAANAVAAASSETRKIVVYMSDGTATEGGSIAPHLAQVPENVDIYTFAVGSASSCTDDGVNGEGSLQDITAATVPGEQCVAVPDADIGSLPDILPGIIASELSSLALSVNGPGGPFTPISNADINPDLPQEGPASVTYSVTTGFLNSGTHVLCVRAFGSDVGGTGNVTDCHTVIINAPPVVDVGGPYSGQEGTPVGLAGDVTDPDNTPTIEWTVAPGPGVDAGATCAFANNAAPVTTITCTDDGTYNLTLTADDGVNPPVSEQTTLTLTNVAPQVSISAPANGALFTRGTPVTFTAPFTDIGTNDTHTCTVDFDDGTPVVPGTVNEVPGSGTCTVSHAFTALGPHDVLVKITDDDGGSATAVVRVVIFLPGGAFALEAKGLLLTIARTPDVRCPPNDARTQVAVNAPPLLTTGVLNASCTLDPNTGTTTARATVAGATLLGGLINLTTIESTSVASASGITRTSRVVGTINGQAVGTSSPLTIGIPGVAVVHLNESTTNPSGQLVQNAVRVEVLGLLGIVSETIILSETYLG